MPLGHALGTLIPGVNVVIVWRHFRLADQLLEKTSAGARLDPMSAALGIVIWWLTFTHYQSDPLFLVLDAVELIAGTAVVVYGQRGLNAYWASRGGEEQILETDLLALAIAGTYAILTIISYLSTPPS
jgi:hypothetical protein